VEHARKYCCGHQRAYTVVCERRTVALSTCAPTLSPRFWLIPGLVNPGENAVERICSPIENRSGCEPKFLTCRDRGQLFGAFDGSVGQVQLSPEKARLRQGRASRVSRSTGPALDSPSSEMIFYAVASARMALFNNRETWKLYSEERGSTTAHIVSYRLKSALLLFDF
jgi:hypothetical protein